MEDELFAAKYDNPDKNIDDCVTYILNWVQKSGCNGFCDDEIYGQAIHYYEEKDIERVYALFPRLKERHWQKGGTLSGGEQQMLAVGRALMSRPDMIMLDEPSLGLAPLLVKEIFNIIRRINEDGMTVLLVEQNAFAALSVAHYAYILEVGRVVLEGTGQELLENPKVKEAYLGG